MQAVRLGSLGYRYLAQFLISGQYSCSHLHEELTESTSPFLAMLQARDCHL